MPNPSAGAPDAALHAFRGPPRTVAECLYALPRHVVEGRVCALLLQGAGAARVHLLERVAADDARGPVAVWEGTALGTLPSRVAALLGTDTPEVTNAVRAALRAHGEYHDLGTVPCPPSPRGAFGHPMTAFARAGEVTAFVVAAT
ncbi:hypothetical protein [Wenjunlia tyrosinilytica]|uniref:Uncharacterized protein n=1 Tax=Wenjunlia tyrosinilytica TaxID=1544741 RepID=A0A917ZIF3_9ACTN|nr:hypothetical protein [Wenjunlia tyrosinilytica]GGO82397.1 hypothetical protein GCM10012280_08900 [Wenjunlia tyrosinilytica]